MSALEALNQRFKELISKDSSENFEVPLAELLEHLYQDLQDNLSLCSYDTQENVKTNFVHAGFILQRTATVYSKKVEFLWQNVLKMLDFLSSRKSLEDVGQNPGDEETEKTGKRKPQKKSIFDSDFMPLVPDLTGFTMMNSENRRMNTGDKISYLTVTPCQLIEKEGREVKPFLSRVNIYAANGIDLLGPKDDFRVNVQFSADQCILGDGILSDKQLDTSLFLATENENFESENGAPSPMNEEDVPLPEVDDPNIEDFCPSGTDENEPPEDHVSIVEESITNKPQAVADKEMITDILEPNNNSLRRSKRQRNIKEQENLKQREAILKKSVNAESVWKPLKPNDVSLVAKNAVKSKRSTLLNKRKLAAKKAGKKLKSDIKVKEYFTDNIKVGCTIKTKECIVNISPECSMDAFDEEQRRKAFKPDPEPPESAPDPPDDIEDDIHDPEGFPATPEWDELDPHEKTQPTQTVEDTYEELVVKRVAEFVAQSQDYIRSTDMDKRVASWHEELKPRLKAVEARGSYDIHTYGTKVLDSFPNDDRKTTIHFDSIVQNVEKEEVSRYFLSCLMLANTQNISIESEGINHLDITLLSRRRHHEDLMSDSPEKRKSPHDNRTIDESGGVIENSHHQQVIDDLDSIPNATPVFKVPTKTKYKKRKK